MKKLVIVGTSETAERILKWCELYGLYEVVGFAINRNYKQEDTFHNRPVWELEELDRHVAKDEVLVFVALFWNHLNGDRRRLYEKVKALGFKFANIISPMASIRGSIGENCWVMDYVVIQEGAIVSNNVFVADNALIGNKAYIGEHCFIGAKSSIMGAVEVGEQTFVGVGATIIESTHVGKKCIIGACTFVKEDTNDYVVVKSDVSSNVVKQYKEVEMEDKMIARYKMVKQTLLNSN